MKHYLLVLLCFTNCLAGSTNDVMINVNVNTIDQINGHMKENYRLPVKKDETLILTGYTVQDTLSHSIKTYSVLHFDF